MGFSLRWDPGRLVLSVLTNRRRAGGAVSGLLTLVVRFGGVELGSGLRVAGRAVGGGCVDAPRRLRRCLDARLARSEALSHRLFLFDGLFSASGLG